MILAYGTFKIRARGACNAVTSRRRRREEEEEKETGERETNEGKKSAWKMSRGSREAR